MVIKGSEYMDLEQWVVNLLESISGASTINSTFDIHLSVDDVKEIASAYNETMWIEIY